jgi:putative nucleotidyltransferase with HDIG domain
VSLSDIFRRSSSRPGRTGISATPARKIYWDERATTDSFRDDTMGPLGVIFCGLLVAAAVYILDYGVLPPVFREGSRPTASVYSRLDFRYNDPNELSRQREESAEKAPRVYVDNPQWVDNMVKDLTALVSVVELAQSAQDLRDRTANFPAEAQLVDELYRAHQEMGERRKFLSTVMLGRIKSSLQVIAGDDLPGSLPGGIVTAADLEFERNKRGEHREIIRVTPTPGAKGAEALKNPGKQQFVPVERLRSVEMAREELRRLSWKESLPRRELENQIYAHLIARMVPSLTLDTVQTELRKEMAQEAVGQGSVQVKQGDVILSKDKLRIPKADIEKLHAEYRAFKKSLPIEARIKHLLGLGAIVFGTLLIFLFVTSRTEPGLLRRRRALVMLGLMLLAGLAVSRFLMLAGFSGVLTPFVFIGIVASLAFGQVVALLALFGLCVLTTLAGVRWEAFPVEGGIPALGLALMAGGIAAALPAQRLRDRWDLLKNGAIGGLVQGILVAGVAFLGEGLNGPTSDVFGAIDIDRLSLLSPRAGVPTLIDAAIALASGPLFALIVLGSLPVIESFFGILTSIRLFELADMNRPALKRIQLEAPGTFAHTLQVRFLAEPASDAIGANTRLISAGVLYHDLGKVLKPEYFVENQMDAPERHRRLRPSVSALLITAHVKDGIELAHEYGLPQQIIDFIPEHHGTTLVSYFFHSAKKKAESEEQTGEGGGMEAVQEAFFRYPGPKPRSRETAIVMLADTVEAASRTLDNPSAARLSAFVHELIMDKMLDGQLDECNLTFAELAMIEEAFVRVLVTRFHSRVRYPGQPEGETVPEGGYNPKTTVVDALPMVGKDTTVIPPVPAAENAPPAPSSRREVLTETRFISRSGRDKKS